MPRSSDVAFGPPKPLVHDIKSKRVEVVKPLDGWDANTRSRITFHIAPSSNEYLSSDFRLLLVFSIRDGNGNPIAAGAQVAFQNLPACSFFDDCELKIGGIVMEGLTSTAHIRNFLKLNLGMSNLSKDTFAPALLKYYPDTNGEAQSCNIAANTGFASRRLLAAGSAAVTVLASIPFDISGSGLAFPTSTEVSITLQNRSNNERLMSNDPQPDYSLRFDKLELHCTYLTLNETSLLSLRHRLASAPLFYPYLRSTLYGPMAVGVGMREVTLTVTKGSIPELALVALSPVAYSANDYAVNPFDFRPNNVSSAQMSAGGVYWPTTPWQMQPNQGLSMHTVYQTFVEVTRALCADGTNVISFEDWVGGLFMIPFQLRAHLPSPAYASTPMDGELTLKLTFSVAIPAPLNVFVFAVDSRRVGIDNARRVLLDTLS